MKICYVSNNFEIHDYRFLVKFVEKKYDVYAVSLRKNEINDKSGKHSRCDQRDQDFSHTTEV